MIDQSVIRKKIQARRAKLTPETQADSSLKICQAIIKAKLLNDAKRVAIYLPVRGEADPGFLRQSPENTDITFYLPVLSSKQQNHLEFALYNEDTPMRFNRFKIPEPDTDKAEILDNPTALDAVIMPMVAVDRAGNRIGMGGGFYDRTFEFRKTDKTKPLLIAFAYDFQLIDLQIPQDWDVPADYIALENEVIIV